MNWFTGAVVYVLIWWTVLFAILPIGTQPVADADPATGWRGAPSTARIGRKFMWTTIVATLLWILAMLLISSDWISFRRGWLYLPDK